MFEDVEAPAKQHVARLKFSMAGRVEQTDAVWRFLSELKLNA
jgi:hypothetical protein